MERSPVKTKALVLVAIIALPIIVIIGAQQLSIQEAKHPDEFYFGISFGGQTPEEAKILIDKVKDYSNLFLINSYDLAINETALNEVCDYAVQAGLKFTVYFDFISRVTYPWHQTWLDNAPTRWNNNFLGVYLHDEPGGKQIDNKKAFTHASNYSQAADLFIQNIAQSNSMIDAKSKSIPTFTSDYVLYWWDYLAGYDVLYAELGWQLDSTQQIALCRGAATTQNKTWGAIIVWTYYEPPYMANAQEIYQEMTLAYEAGAKYVVVFNYPTYPEDNPYGVLSTDQFKAMENFWNYAKANPRPNGGEVHAKAALILPQDYGWGMRRNKHLPEDNIWGLWPEDEKSPIILENINKLLTRYGLDLDIVFDDTQFNFNNNYNTIYYWNETIR
ncbi:MAG: hypothetical protein LBI79_06505 [Nitrososphaerota archaeon]|jgi:hypothetical protein|nr:hypothetical protein [Nitrososphaerota archaeon]